MLSTLLLAFLIGVTCGLRSLAPLAAVSWTARLAWLAVDRTWLPFLGFAITPWILSVAAIGELITDKLPKTPSRKAPPGFIARLVTGALCGGAFGAPSAMIAAGLICGILGAVVGTFGGYEFRTRLVRATGGKDLPIALLEDLIAVAGAILLCRSI